MKNKNKNKTKTSTSVKLNSQLNSPESQQISHQVPKEDNNKKKKKNEGKHESITYVEY